MSSFYLKCFYVFGAAAVGLILVSAEDPARLDADRSKVLQDQTAVRLPSTPEETPKPPEPPPPVDPMVDLSPPTMTTAQSLTDVGFGSSYGSGGGGPGVGGQGFGNDQGQLVKSGSEGDRTPRLVSRAPLEYPSEAKAKGLRGFVAVKIYVGAGGQVEDIKVFESEPAGVFDQAVLQSIKSWKFEPGMNKGQVAAMWINQKIKFEME